VSHTGDVSLLVLPSMLQTQFIYDSCNRQVRVLAFLPNNLMESLRSSAVEIAVICYDHAIVAV